MTHATEASLSQAAELRASAVDARRQARQALHHDDYERALRQAEALDARAAVIEREVARALTRELCLGGAPT